jgi:hypothetical protein
MKNTHILIKRVNFIDAEYQIGVGFRLATEEELSKYNRPRDDLIGIILNHKFYWVHPDCFERIK